MRLSKPIKILVGIGTLWYALYPLLFIAVWLFMVSSIFFSVNLQQSDTPFFMLPFIAIFPLHIFTMLLSFVLIAFYLIHVIKNKKGSETIRIILGIGCFFIPFIAMPIYYYTFIWRDELPSWAQETTKPQQKDTDLATN